MQCRRKEAARVRPEEGARKQIEMYRRMTGKQRLRIAMELYEVSRELIAHNIRMMHPGISEDEFRKKLAARMTKRNS
jgi:hypothetical protein